jgi:septum formation protein
MQQLILASTSPRRRELLALLGRSFTVCTPAFEELPVPGVPPVEQVRRFALEKARSVAEQETETFVLGSDTVIEIDGRMLGKPMDLAEAKAMLTQLAGRAHYVHSAVALCCLSRQFERVAVESATVWMKPYQEDAVERYLKTTESLGKAGAYSIQGEGGRLVSNLEGDYTAVVGLPLRLVARLLKEARLPAPVDPDTVYRTKPYPNWAAFSS